MTGRRLDALDPDRGAPIAAPPAEQPWGRIEFSVRDPDGYVLCFSEAA